MVLDFIFYLTHSIQKNLSDEGVFTGKCHCKPGDLQTNFTENPEFMFKVYQPSRSIFTWSDSISYGYN